MRTAVIAAALILSAALPASSQTKITIINVDAPGQGLNDASPAQPVGGNHGTTLGEQRRIALEHAAQIWAGLIDSAVEIKVEAGFNALACSSDGAVLASAGPVSVYRDFANAPFRNTWYVSALASKLAGHDLDEGGPSISTRFNSRLGQPGCGASGRWYYGLDGNPPFRGVDLIVVALHELAHGLGFTTITDKSSGAFVAGQPDAYSRFLFDNTEGLTWPLLSAEQRAGSARNSRNLAWSGPNAAAAAPARLGPAPLFEISEPASLHGPYPVALADFGGEITIAGTTGTIVAAIDGADAAGPSTTDGCSSILNAADVAGKIALIDRGECTFAIKATVAQNAGAVAVVIANNVDGAPQAMSGDEPFITIPVVGVSRADGAAIRERLAEGVVATIRQDPLRLAGADEQRRPLVYAPAQLSSGSSIAHWDPSTRPNLLMEPSISSDLTHDVDLTRDVFADIGWYADATLKVALTRSLIDDRNGDGDADPGDTVRVVVTVRNESGVAANDVVVAITIPSGASASTSEATLGDIAAGASASATFDLVVDPSLPAGTRSLPLQGSVAAANLRSTAIDEQLLINTPLEGGGPRVTTVLHVPAQFPTIQTAIEAAGDGDHVVVGPGTYVEAIDLLGKKITLRSAAGAAATILDGAALDVSIITANSAESTATIVRGFTFRNGIGRFTGACGLGGRLGGAIFVLNGGITVGDSIFEANGTFDAENETFSINGGSAIFACNSDLVVSGSVFRDSAAAFGGAVTFTGAAGKATISASRFERIRGVHGGAIFSQNDLEGEFNLTTSHFLDNEAVHGGAVRIAARERSRAMVAACSFRNNASAFGGGMNASGNERVKIDISNNDFSGNRAGYGGGLFAIATGFLPTRSGAEITIRGNRFFDNISEECCDVGDYIDGCFRDRPENDELYGGAADLRTQEGGVIRVINSVFARNTGGLAAGIHASSCVGGQVELINNTIVDNGPGAILMRLDVPENPPGPGLGNFKVVNSIVRGNGTGEQISLSILADGPAATVSFSNVDGGFEGAGNIDEPVIFAGSGPCHFRLAPGTAGVDAGDNAAMHPAITTDLDGHPRFAGAASIVDMGAYELQTPEPGQSRRRAGQSGRGCP